MREQRKLWGGEGGVATGGRREYIPLSRELLKVERVWYVVFWSVKPQGRVPGDVRRYRTKPERRRIGGKEGGENRAL